jgi:hypothetical protein
MRPAVLHTELDCLLGHEDRLDALLLVNRTATLLLDMGPRKF